MKYSDLFTLNPIETVIKIDEADKESEAKRLVDTFVITPSLAEAFETIALPQLDLENPTEGKGIFVVGNYGTGKSHVMSFLSIIAEDASYLPNVHSNTWRGKFGCFAGKYKVKRCQIAASMMNLYQIVAEQLGKLAKDCGFEFKFRDQREFSNVKDEFQRFMVAFDSVCPGKGVLLIVDELLHYLQSRNDQELVIDLSVLQSLGEFSDKQRFVFIAGLQQSLFNNPKFNHVAADLNRVKQRYYDLVIDSKGVGQLIEQYLFQKNASQRDTINAMMLKQAPLFEIIGPEIDQFVRLFPAHPSFIAEFERVFVVERREILTVLSKEARKLADQTVETDGVDLITSDKYWDHIERDQGLNANRSVQQIKQNVSTLKARIQTEFPATEDVAAAERLVKALGVNRLTPPNIDDEVGLKPEELKNRLLWKTKIPLESASFLTNAAKRQLDNTRKAANGQFLAVSETTGQYFIDPKRVVDYDQDVATAASTINKQVVQRYLNEIITRALELDNEQLVYENRLWNYDLLWTEHNVERPGWLFFGFPNQRSTAQPPRDFYIFLIPSERITGLKEPFSTVDDEIYVTFEDFPPAKCDEKSTVAESEKDSFLDTLRKYAAAREKENSCRPGDEKSAFKSIAERHLKNLAPTFVDNATEWLSVKWNGQTKKFGAWVLELDPSKVQAQFRTKLDSIATIMFSQHFQAKYPDYPTFSIKVQERTRKQNASSAIEIICKEGVTTTQGKAVLAALELYKDDAPTPDQSPWLDIIRQKHVQIGIGKNLNHSDLFERRDGKDWWLGQNVEAEWLHVVLAAGVAAGDLIVIGPMNRRYDASTLREFYSEVSAFTNIINVAKPSGIPLDEWRKLFQAFGLKIGKLANASTYDDAIKDFQTAVVGRVTELVTQEQELKTPLPYVRPEVQTDLAALLPAFGELKSKLETVLVPINTKARMPNLKLTLDEIANLSNQLNACSALGGILQFVKANEADLNAVQRLESVLGAASTDFTAKRASLEDALNAVYADPASLSTNSVTVLSSIHATLEAALKSYHELHKKYRLDMAGDRKKGAVTKSTTLKQLNKLTHVEVLPAAKLEDWRQVFIALVFCGGCSDAELVKDPLSQCPHCRFDPRVLPAGAISANDLMAKCEDDLEKLRKSWTTKLIQEVSDPSVIATLSALTPAEFDEINKLIGSRKLPDEITDTFLQAINTALKGIKRKTLSASSFASQVLGDGTPLKPEELRHKFESWLKSQVGDDDPNTVRFMLES
jgi:hypothetical protein